MTAADQIVGRIVLAAKARLASREAAQEVKRKSVDAAPAQPARQAGRLQIDRPGRDRSCSSSKGDSAGGSAKQGRNNQTQAVLPLRGKILNSEGLALAKVLTNPELTDLVTAIGTGAGDKFNLGGLRYGKIILLMDADADGHHITTLMLAFFFRHMTGADSQGASLHRPAAALPHRRRQGDVLGPRRRAQGRDSSKMPAKSQRQAGDHALQGPRRDDAEDAGGDDAGSEDAHACCTSPSTPTWKRTRRSSSCSARTRRRATSSSWSRRTRSARRSWMCDVFRLPV